MCISLKRLRVKRDNWLPYLIYALLSLAILGPLLRSGYILTLDTTFAPKMDFTVSLYGLSDTLLMSAPLRLLLHGVSEIIPAWLLQKAIFSLIFFLAGLGAYRLFSPKGVGSYFAGLLYAVNPFTYTRFLAGHWNLVLAYALIPFAIKVFVNLLEKGGKKNIIKVALLSTFVGIASIHGLVLLFLAFFIIFLVKLVKERKRSKKIISMGKSIGISASTFLALNFYWLVPVLSNTGTVLNQISRTDLLFFAPKPISGFGVAFDTASMYGFWREGYVHAKDMLPFWWVFFIFILFLAVYGFINWVFTSPVLSYPSQVNGEETFMERRWVVVSFGIIGAVSLTLAMGVATKFARPPFEWAWEHVLILRGFRDSQKFVTLLCLAYSFLGGLGGNEFVKGLRQQRKRLPRIGMTALIAIALLTPVIYTFTMFGFYKQLEVTDYPQEWYEVNDYLNQDTDAFNVLFLPWHLYMDFSWLPNSDKRLANPAQLFFDKSVIAGDNIEVPGIYSQSINPVSKYVEFLLTNRNDVNNLGELLAPLNIKYIILVNEADYADYNFLYHQNDLKVELEKPGITLLKNEHPVARIYGVDSVVYIESLDEYLELSKAQDVMEHLYILGSGSNSGEDGGMQRLDFTEKSPVKYWVESTQAKYTIFTAPQNVSTEHWDYNGKQPLKNLGFMPAFELDEGGGEIVYTRFYHVYLSSYIVSAVALMVLLLAYFNKGKMAKLIPCHHRKKGN